MTPFSDTSAINAIINHPSVRNAALNNTGSDLDVTPLIDSGEAMFLGDDKGGFLVHHKADGLWEVHTQFLPEARGPSVVEKARSAIHYMFTKTDCLELVTFVPDGNRLAMALALRCGFRVKGRADISGIGGEVLLFSIKDWALCQ